MKKIPVLLSVLSLCLSGGVFAQQAKNSPAKADQDLSVEEVAKKLANPVAKLISLPIEVDTDFGVGPFRGTRNTTNIQPVMPFQISEKWNVITRVVLPVVMQYDITGPATRQRGLSDTEVTAFFSPIPKKEGLIWGAGPIFLAPTGTQDLLTNKKWGVGPSAVALIQKNGWTAGAMINQVWSFAGDRNRDAVNQMLVEPFASYQWKSGAGVMILAEYSQDWRHDRSSMIMQASVSGITSIGEQKVQILIGPRVTVFGPSEMRSDLGFTCGITLPFIK
ncbi:hypothetical protein ACYSNM_04545 [Myroides sp. LJL116]